MEPNAKIKVILFPIDNTLDLASTIFLVAMWILTLYTFLKLPWIIPIHFNLSGHADNYGIKFIILIFPFLATVIYFGLTQLSKYPHIFTYMTKITEANAHKQYITATRMLRFLKLTILLIFSSIIISIYLTASAGTDGLGFWFFPLIFGLLFTHTLISIGQSFSKKNN